MTYKVLGADGKQYGPVTEAQLRQWIAEGRANAQSMIQAEGSSEWKQLGTFPEFQATAPPASVPLPSAPRPITGDVNEMANQLIVNATPVSIGSCVSRAWALLTGNLWPILGCVLLGLLVQMVASGIPYLGACIGIFVNGPIIGGISYYLLKQIRGEQATAGDIFAGFSLAYWPLVLVALVSGLLTVLGFILCIIPGIYLGVAWAFAIPLVIDKRMEFWDAMELSRKVVTKQWWTIFGLFLVNFLLVLAGFIVCCVGIFFTIPLSYAVMMYAYEDLFGATRATQPASVPIPIPAA